MGQRVSITKFDDIDGTEGSDIETFTFAVDGKSYEIDVTPDKADRVREVLSEFIEKGRRATDSSKRSRSGGGNSSGPRPPYGEIRKWARENGIEVNTNGRVQQEVVDQWMAAHAA